MEVFTQVEVVLSVGVEWRSKVLAARGYPEVDGNGPVIHPAIMYDFIGRSNRALWGSQKPQRIRTQPNHFNEPFKSDTA